MLEIPKIRTVFMPQYFCDFLSEGVGVADLVFFPVLLAATLPFDLVAASPEPTSAFTPLDDFSATQARNKIT